jgi:hypothetical protein
MKRIVALVSLLLALGVLTAARAIADNGMSLSLAPTATLTGRVLVTAPVTITCQLLVTDPSTRTPVSPFVQLSVVQAANKSLHNAFGSTQLPASACDNSAHTFAVSATGGPFHGGTAVASAMANMCGFTTTPVGTSSSLFICENASAGPQGIKLSH